MFSLQINSTKVAQIPCGIRIFCSFSKPYLNDQHLGSADSSASPNFKKPSAANGYYFGAGHQTRFNGLVSESIVYNRALAPDEKDRVNSYLALKYGITLPGNYVDSDSHEFWSQIANNGYNNRITGIGRDDKGAQEQYQSKSQSSGANVTIALGDTIEATNAANKKKQQDHGSRAADQSFLLFGDNGADATYASGKKLTKDGSTAIQTLARVYKIQKTNWADAGITLKADKVDEQTGYPQHLIISSSAALDTDVKYFDVNQTDGTVTINSSELNGFFTFGSAYPVPNSAQLELGAVDVDDDSLRLTFDRNITLEDLDGFTITVGGETVDLNAGSVSFEIDGSNPKTLIIKIPEADLSKEGSIEVSYDGSGTLKDAESKLPVKPFDEAFEVVNKVPLQAKITEAEGITNDEYTPESWQALQDALDHAKVVRADANATQDAVNAALTALKNAIDGLAKNSPQPVNPKTFVEGATSITIPFDKALAAEGGVGSGFTVSYVDENGNTGSIVITDAAITGDDRIELQLATPLSGKWTVTVAYAADAGTLKGAGPDGTKVEDFSFSLTDPFVAALKITAPAGNTPDRTPTVTGAVYENADSLTVTVKDSNGNTLDVKGTLTWNLGNTAWSYDIEDELPPGTYTVEVTATSGDRTVTKQYTFTVVDKSALTAEIDREADLHENDYTSSSWEAYQAALDEAKGVRDNPLASQEEVNAALEKLQAAREALVPRSNDSGDSGDDGSSDSGDSNGSGSSTGGGDILGTSGNTETIVVDVVIGGDQAADITKVPIYRTTHGDGTITDQVTFAEDKAKETVEKAIATGKDIARVVIPDAEDQVDELKVTIPSETAKLLQENGIDLEIYTENAVVRIPKESLDGIDEDFYFRLVPVRDENERQEIEQRAKVEAVVREVAGDSEIEVVARPMTIETNLSSRPVTLILPLKDVELPENEAAREAFLSQLGIFIEHTDGEKEVVRGKVVTYNGGLLGLQFSVTKFSTFTIINFNDLDHGSHIAYIEGFPDGEFKPDSSVTRAQLALMIARNLDFDRNAKVDQDPFEDVPATHYAAAAIAFVKARGIMSGYPDGSFRADAPITRAEMATVVANDLNLPIDPNGQASFGDTSGHWAQEIIDANLSAGIIQGYPDGRFRPDQSLTRAEAVVMINQMFDRGPLHGGDASRFSDVSESHWAYEHIQEAALDHEYIIDAEKREQYVK